MLTIKDLTVKFPSRFGDFTAIEDVDMTIKPGEIHGLVGESGAGKSTVGDGVPRPRVGIVDSRAYRSTSSNTGLRQ